MTTHPSSRGEGRIAEFAGFAIAVLFVIFILITPSALLDPEHSLESLAKAYSLHRSSVLATGWISALTWVVAFLAFAGSLSSSLSGGGRTPKVCAWVGLAGASVESLVILVVILLSQAAAFTADAVEPAEIGRASGRERV